MSKYVLGPLFQGNPAVSQIYKNNPDYYKQFGLAGHEGVDYATAVGVPIIAPFDYKILRDNDDFKNNNYGNFIVVWDPIQRCAVWFCHLSENYVTYNQTGKKGDILGKTGNSGNTTGPHCHINFVETSPEGARLNMNNGFQGFLNILDTALVEFKTEIPMTTGPILPTELQHYTENWKDIVIQKGLDVNNIMFSEYHNIDAIIAKKVSDVDKINIQSKQIIDNLNQQINDRNNDIVQLNAQLTTLKAQLGESQIREQSLSEQAKQLPALKEQVTELERQKKVWNDTEAIYKKKIKEISDENAKLRSNWINGILKSIFKK